MSSGHLPGSQTYYVSNQANILAPTPVANWACCRLPHLALWHLHPSSCSDQIPFSHIPHPVHQQILSASPSEYIHSSPLPLLPPGSRPLSSFPCIIEVTDFPLQSVLRLQPKLMCRLDNVTPDPNCLIASPLTPSKSQGHIRSYPSLPLCPYLPLHSPSLIPFQSHQPSFGP